MVPAQWVPWPLPSDRLRSGECLSQEAATPELQVVNVDTRVDDIHIKRLRHHHTLYTYLVKVLQVSLGPVTDTCKPLMVGSRAVSHDRSGKKQKPYQGAPDCTFIVRTI